jgi:plastocyanin
MNRLLPLAGLLCIMGPLQFALGEGQTQRIEMKNVAFVPADLRVRVGDTVEWDNSDIAAHTATSKEGGFDVNVVPGRKGSVVVKRPGTFAYICRYHPNMKGQLIVDP